MEARLYFKHQPLNRDVIMVTGNRLKCTEIGKTAN